MPPKPINLAEAIAQLHGAVTGGAAPPRGGVPDGLSEVAEDADKAGKAIKQYDDRLSKLWTHPHKFMMYAASWTAMYSAIRAGIQVISFVATRMLDLEEATARVSIVTKQSTEDIRENIDMLSTRYGKSVKEVGKALNIFAQQGITFTKAVKLTDLAMQGSLATGDELGTQVERLTGLYQGYKMTVMEVARAQDIIIATSKRAGVTMGNLADSHIKIAATARDMGLEFAQVNALVISMAESMRLSGSEASRALGMMLQRMFRPKTIETLERAGVRATGPQGRRNPMEILQELGQKFPQMPFWQQEEVVQQVAGVRRGRQMRAMMQGLESALSRANEALSETAATANASAIMMDTARNRWARAAEGMSASFGGFWAQWWKGVQTLHAPKKDEGAVMFEEQRRKYEARRQAQVRPMQTLGELRQRARGMIEEGVDWRQLYDILGADVQVRELEKGRFAAEAGPAQIMEQAAGGLPEDIRRKFFGGAEPYEGARPGYVPVRPEMRGVRFQAQLNAMLSGMETRAQRMVSFSDRLRRGVGGEGGAEEFGAKMGMAVTPEQKEKLRTQQLEEQVRLRRIIVNMLKEQAIELSKAGGDEQNMVELKRISTQMTQIETEMLKEQEQIRIEALRIEKARGAEAERLTGSMSGALEAGMMDILRRGAGIEALGAKLGDVIAGEAVKKIMSSGIFKSMMEGIQQQAGGAGFGELTGGQKIGALVGYGMMGYQQGGAAGAGLAAAGGAAFGPLGATVGSWIGSLFQRDEENWSEMMQENRTYYDASLQELRLMNRSLLAAIGYDFYALPGSYYYSQRANTGVQSQNLVFSTRDSVVNVTRADLSHSVRSSMIS